MSDFYGKRFLSSLVGALTVLGSPVASAGKNGSDRGDLGKGVHSAGRNKNNGKLGELKSNREVKSVDGLKKVLKETGGKVVRVSPNGKGGFVAFIKTPTGKVVTVAIVGVPLLVIISYLVFFRRKNGEIIKGVNVKKPESIEGASITSADLLEKLFGSNENSYNSFFDKLFQYFFAFGRMLGQEVSNYTGSLDEFLRVVFARSSFGTVDIMGNRDDSVWMVGEHYALVKLGREELVFTAFDRSVDRRFFENVFEYLSANSFIVIPKDDEQASWGDKISAILFSFWCSVKFELNIKDDAEKVGKALRDKNSDNLKRIFKVISRYVGDRLLAAGRGYNGQKLDPVN